MGNFPAALNSNRLFLKLNWFSLTIDIPTITPKCISMNIDHIKIGVPPSPDAASRLWFLRNSFILPAVPSLPPCLGFLLLVMKFSFPPIKGQQSFLLLISCTNWTNSTTAVGFFYFPRCNLHFHHSKDNNKFDCLLLAQLEWTQHGRQ